MKIVVVADEMLKEEFLTQGLATDASVEWLPEIKPVPVADCYIDLLFSPGPDRIGALQQLQPAMIIVNAVTNTLDELPQNFIRINGWPTFLKRSLTEASGTNEDLKEKAENIFSCFNKKIEWVPNIPGFITARVISMIINEAFFALDEKVSTKKEIDTAMKLGTNYPYGPFEWAKKIGLMNIYELLTTLAATNSRYTPSALLKKEALTI